MDQRNLHREQTLTARARSARRSVAVTASGQWAYPTGLWPLWVAGLLLRTHARLEEQSHNTDAEPDPPEKGTGHCDRLPSLSPA